VVVGNVGVDGRDGVDVRFVLREVAPELAAPRARRVHPGRTK
jgi:hypothetical protein